MKHLLCLILSCILLLACCSVLADGAPTSQFGFKGWPYRQNTPCKGSCALGCSQCGSEQDCAKCAQCQAVYATARPAQAPVKTAAPKPAATPAPQATQTPAAAPIRTPAPQATQKPPVVNSGDYTPSSATTQEKKALDLMNGDRARNGLNPLPLDAELSRLARIKAQDMKDNHYFAHESPTYGNAASMLKRFGYAYSGVGENIAHHATVEKAEAAFMSSTGHRTNILGSQWKRVGIGVCPDDQGFVYVVQIFVR